MKRSHQDTGDSTQTPLKRMRMEDVVPLGEFLKLTHIHLLHQSLGSFCVMFDEGLAIQDKSCHYCDSHQRPTVDDAAVDKMLHHQLSLMKKDSYKIDVLVRDIWERGGTTDIQATTPNERQHCFHFGQVKHLSWFAIQLLLSDSPVVEVLCDLRKGDLSIVYSTDITKTEDKRDTTLQEVLLRYQRALVQLAARQFIGDGV